MNTNLVLTRRYARELYDFQKMRVAISNQKSAAERDGRLVDTIEPMEQALKQVEKAENIITKQLVTAFKDEAPQNIVDFAVSTRGISNSGSPKLLARLVGEVGDFDTWQEAHWESPKTGEKSKKVLVLGDTYELSVRELWTYCGVGNPAKSLRFLGKNSSQADVLACGNPIAKMLVWNLAHSQMQTRGPYRELYDTTKEKYLALPHPDKCTRCGPAGKPAQPGSTRSKGHADAIAHRHVSKALLKDLWRVRHNQAPSYGGEWIA